MTGQPELGQMLFGATTGDHGTPEWVDSLFDGVMREFERVWWNIHQESHSERTGDLGKVHYRNYWQHEDQDTPHFWVDGDPQAIYWYKHAGRGQSCKLEYTPEQWIAWHDRVMSELSTAESETPTP